MGMLMFIQVTKFLYERFLFVRECSRKVTFPQPAVNYVCSLQCSWVLYPLFWSDIIKKLLSVIHAPEFSNLDITSGLSLQHTASSSVQPPTQFPHLHQSWTWPPNGSSVSDGDSEAEFCEISYHLGQFHEKTEKSSLISMSSSSCSLLEGDEYGWPAKISFRLLQLSSVYSGAESRFFRFHTTSGSMR